MNEIANLEKATQTILKKNGITKTSQILELSKKPSFVNKLLKIEGIGISRINHIVEVIAPYEKSCRTCFYFQKFQKPTEDVIGDGWCVRHPPVFIGNHSKSLGGGEIWGSARVHLNEWCGEHK